MPAPTQIARSSMVSGRVVSNTALTERLFALRVAGEFTPFQAGQFVRLELEIDGEQVARPYSLVNPPDDPVAEVFYNTVPGGRLTTTLARLEAGDRVAVSQPAVGFFVLDEVPPVADLWMIATGTGLGPYLSMLRTRTPWERFEKVLLVHGVPLREELVYREVIAGVQRAHPGRFRYLTCVSREHNPGGISGRVTDAIRRGELERLAGAAITASDSGVMLCGNHAMIREVFALLSGRGLRKHLRRKPGQILSEEYF